MWDKIFIGLFTATTVFMPRTSFQALGSPFAVQASGSVANGTIGSVIGSIQVQQSPYSLGVSASESDGLAAVYGYSNQYVYTPTNSSHSITTNVSVTGNFASESSYAAASVIVQSPSITGSPSATLSTTLTENGVSDFGVELSADWESYDAQVDAKLSGDVNQGISVEGSTQIGSVNAYVSRNGNGTWNEKLDANVTLMDEVTLIVHLHQTGKDLVDYALNLSFPYGSMKVLVTPNESAEYSVGTMFTFNTTLYNVTIQPTILANVGYISSSGSITYNLTTDVGPFTGEISGTLYDNYALGLTIDLSVFEISINIDFSGQLSSAIQMSLNDTQALIVFDENFNPTSFTGNFWSNPSLTFYTAFDGNYSFSVTDEEQDLTFE